MKKVVLLLGLVCLVMLAACSGSSGPLKIDSVTLARDDGNGNAGETVTSFSPSDRTLHAVAKLNQIVSGVKVTFTWVAVDAGGETNQPIESVDDTPAAANVDESKLTLPHDWPTGKYRLDVYLDGTLAQSV